MTIPCSSLFPPFCAQSFLGALAVVWPSSFFIECSFLLITLVFTYSKLAHYKGKAVISSIFARWQSICIGDNCDDPSFLTTVSVIFCLSRVIYSAAFKCRGFNEEERRKIYQVASTNRIMQRPNGLYAVFAFNSESFKQNSEYSRNRQNMDIE